VGSKLNSIKPYLNSTGNTKSRNCVLWNNNEYIQKRSVSLRAFHQSLLEPYISSMLMIPKFTLPVLHMHWDKSRANPIFSVPIMPQRSWLKDQVKNSYFCFSVFGYIIITYRLYITCCQIIGPNSITNIKCRHTETKDRGL
jgi:hypothetical protein